MKLTIKKGLLRLAGTAVYVFVGFQFIENRTFIMACAIVTAGWGIYWLISGFFGMD